MNRGALSEQIRERAVQKYVRPALQGGQDHFSIAVKDLMQELEPEGFPPKHQHQFCTAVQTQRFLAEHGLEIDRVDGPPSKKSTTVVVHYRRKRAPGSALASVSTEDPKDRAKRLTDKLYGVLRDELAEYGGAEGFIRWIRSDDGDAA